MSVAMGSHVCKPEAQERVGLPASGKGHGPILDIQPVEVTSKHNIAFASCLQSCERLQHTQRHNQWRKLIQIECGGPSQGLWLQVRSAPPCTDLLEKQYSCGQAPGGSPGAWSRLAGLCRPLSAAPSATRGLQQTAMTSYISGRLQCLGLGQPIF